MCGIAGYVGDHAPELLQPMCLAMAHRGPDDMGVWHDEMQRVGFGHRRLSIIDLSPAGHQPMASPDGTVWITYNGEVYNYLELREKLIAKGHQFRGGSDTEVLVHLYQEHGESFLNQLDGMFAFGLWDATRQRLLLARDATGVKPLYYWQDGSRLYFASEIKALLRVPAIRSELNEDRIADYLTFLWVPGDETLLRGIRKLEPGHSLVWQDGRTTVRRWFSLAYEPDDSVSENEWVERVRETFFASTRRQMVSDVPLGAFLSGGVDSSAIVASMRRAFPDREIQCYTAHFAPADAVRDQFVDDLPYAERVAQHLGVTLHSFLLEPDLISLLPRMVHHLDEPNADPAVLPSYLISRRAREDGIKVLLSGTGGDEMFFGYRSHEAYAQYQRLAWAPRAPGDAMLGLAGTVARRLLGAQSAPARRIERFRRGFRETGLARHMAIVDWSSPEVRASVLSPALRERLGHTNSPPACMQRYWDAFQGRGELNRHSHMLIQTFLAAHNFLYSDKSSMAASLEIRVPFMDLELMRLAARIPERVKLRGRETKWVLKKAMEGILPNDVLYRSKTGFGVPLRKWVADDLAPAIRELLSPERLRRRGLFDPAAVERVLRENADNRADHAYLIYALFSFELWLETFVDRAGEMTTLPAVQRGSR